MWRLILYRVAGEGLTDKAIREQRPERSEEKTVSEEEHSR